MSMMSEPSNNAPDWQHPSERELLRSMVTDVAVIKAGVQDIKQRDDDTENRLRRVERMMYVAMGMAAASGVGTLTALLTRVPQ